MAITIWTAKAAAPLGPIGHPGDIAKIGVFLASGESGWVGGARIEGAAAIPDHSAAIPGRRPNPSCP
ncbi:MAG: hypothetical protein ACXWLX_11740, partial [Rhizomicrobium sp.]